MQGIAALNPASPVQPYTQNDFKRIANTVGTFYENLDPEKKKALSGLADEIAALPLQKLKVFDQLLNFLEQHANRYPEVVDELVRNGAVDEGDMPAEYSPPIFATIHAMVRESINKASSSAKKFAKGGLASVKESAKRVQAAGRGEDKILAHITPAEAELLKARGGSGDINPATGLPEYGWLKSIGKLLGFAAPIIGTVVGGMVGMPFLGAVVGGGLGGLASGGGVKGALMGAAMGGIGSLAFGGLSNVLSGSGTFMEGVTGALPSYLGGTGESFGGTLFGSGASGGTGMSGSYALETATNAKGVAGGDLTDLQNSLPTEGPRTVTPGTGGASPTISPSSTASKGVSFLDDPMKWIKTNPGTALALGGGALLAANALGGEKKAPASLAASHPDLTQSERQAKYPWTVVDSSKFVSNYTPAAKVPEYSWQQGVYSSPNFPQTGGVAQNVASAQPSNQQMPPPQSYVIPQGAYSTPQFTRAATGGIMDARTGGHLNGPGTGKSDSIPAKLSDGEFVMTAKAVRGAGGGDRMKGAKKMYELMHKFERVA